ncbi:SPOR domain-containing protein [Elizabethkingia anophelis]|uniref:SPOR domain-containing protein n=1 Tax=Elizabethkingia anophelis TaxID=1117645 RepID=UPI0038924D7C
MNRKIFILIILLALQYLNAQETILRKDSINGNAYSIEMDIRIDDHLRQMEDNCMKSIVNNKIDGKRKSIVKKPVVRKELVNKMRFATLSIADICKKKPKLMGYKIQVSVTNNSNDANKIRYQFRQKFPNLRTELDNSLRPNYKILAGSFFSKQSGRDDLKSVRGIYHEAILIPYRIFCIESK